MTYLTFWGGKKGETTTIVYVKTLKEAVHAGRHSNRSVSIITYIQPRRGEEGRQVPFHEGFPWGNYTSNEFLEIRSDCTWLVKK